MMVKLGITVPNISAKQPIQYVCISLSVQIFGKTQLMITEGHCLSNILINQERTNY